MPDVYDVLTLGEAKTFLRNDGFSGDDLLVASYVTAISRRLDELVGPIVRRAVVESHDGMSGPFDAKSYIKLRVTPVVSVTSVSEYPVGSGTATILVPENRAAPTPNDYVVDIARGLVVRRASGHDAQFPADRGNIIVSYTAGYALNTLSVDPRFKEAAGITLTHMWRADLGSGTQAFGAVPGEIYPTGFALPNRAVELLGFARLAKQRVG